MRELFHEILSSLRNNKLRTALTGFAVSWGIFLLIALLGAGNGLMNSFMGNVSAYTDENIRVEGWYTTEPYDGYQSDRRIELDEKDVAYTAGKEWEGVIKDVTKLSNGVSVTLSRNKYTVSGYVLGCMPEYQGMNKVRMAYGRFISPADERERRKAIVISLYQAKELSPGAPEDLIGQWIPADNISFRVVGIYHTDEGRFTQTDYIPYSTAKGCIDVNDKVEDILFHLVRKGTTQDYKKFETDYGNALKKRHHIAPYDERGIWIWNVYTQNSEMSTAQNILSIALWILGILTLIGGIVGVSNIMLITVKERTHEFGVRKAIGAKPGHILSLIIAESITITAIFGYVGMFFGIVACEIMDKTIGQNGIDLGFGEEIYMLSNPGIGIDIALGATLVLIIAGTIAGAIPAWKAARVKPIEALRAE